MNTNSNPPCIIIGINNYAGGIPMKTNFEERAIELAEYIIENKATVRKAASVFGFSKSTVHTVVTK